MWQLTFKTKFLTLLTRSVAQESKSQNTGFRGQKRSSGTCHSDARAQNTVDQLMNHYSSWPNLKRAVAWFLILKSLLKELTAKRKEPNTLSEEIRMSRFKKTFKGAPLTYDVFGKSKVLNRTWQC